MSDPNPARQFLIPAAAVIVAILMIPSGAPAQEPVTEPLRRAAEEQEITRPLRVFLDCQTRCDREYLVTELPYIHFVRDRVDADVHVLLTSLEAASGGEEFTIGFFGQNIFASRSDTLVAVTPPNASDDDEREQLRRTIALGLLPFAARTTIGAQLDVEFSGDMSSANLAQVAGDPWNSWVFEAEVGGSANIQQRQRSWRTDGEFNSRRITERWKVELELQGEYESSEFDLSGDRTATNTLVAYGAEALVVRSLGDHLSAGFTAEVGHSDYYNQRFAARMGPAVEYNLLDWDEATRQRVTFRYSIGVTNFSYIEETIYLRTAETIVSQHIGVAGRLRQPWGSANASIDFGNVVDQPTKNVLSVDAFAEVRVTGGLNVFGEVEASRVRNQLYLPRGDLSDEEILLGQRALATDYRYEVRLGLGYTFGSIFNTIVNPRFGGGIDIF